MNNNDSALHGISPYIFGTTKLGDEHIPREDRLNMAKFAMESGVWFHTARMYGDALEVLGEAFAQEPSKVPKLIIKIGWENINQVKETIEENIKPLGLSGVQLGQLCLSGQLAEDFARGGDCFRIFQDIKNEGLVKGFVIEAFPWTSQLPLDALRQGYSENVIDGYIFYLNPLQRFASNELWKEIIEQNKSIIAMRTVSGGPVHSLRDVPGFAWKDYLQKRAVEIAPIFEKSEIPSWTEFCIRFAFSFNQVKATIGSTSKEKNLNDYLSAVKNIKPLPEEIMNEIKALQYKWSDEVDMHAEQWTM